MKTEPAISFQAVALHLKAGGGFQDRQRRQEAVVLLEDFLRDAVDGGGNVFGGGKNV